MDSYDQRKWQKMAKIKPQLEEAFRARGWPLLAWSNDAPLFGRTGPFYLGTPWAVVEELAESIWTKHQEVELESGPSTQPVSQPPTIKSKPQPKPKPKAPAAKPQALKKERSAEHGHRGTVKGKRVRD